MRPVIAPAFGTRAISALVVISLWTIAPTLEIPNPFAVANTVYIPGAIPVIKYVPFSSVISNPTIKPIPPLVRRRTIEPTIGSPVCPLVICPVIIPGFSVSPRLTFSKAPAPRVIPLT